LIEADGWRHVRTTGSHRHFKHPTKPNLVTIPGNAGDDVPVGTMKAILKSAGIDAPQMNPKYTVIFERAVNNWAAYVPDLPGCMTTGKTLEETKVNIKEAIDGHIKTLREFGDPVPEPVSIADAIEVSPAA